MNIKINNIIWENQETHFAISLNMPIYNNYNLENSLNICKPCDLQIKNLKKMFKGDLYLHVTNLLNNSNDIHTEPCYI